MTCGFGASEGSFCLVVTWLSWPTAAAAARGAAPTRWLVSGVGLVGPEPELDAVEVGEGPIVAVHG
ncbi:hypothetical protein EV186_102548 [Labedaea rhizosphaerae]|uniref:Uncharacterized protein n=1 Tax=Labedaea rhizosphaerae TaxID=598644 RepID=A0A4R6SH57_LABRH|nr:hypothetical protein EV186_102548 [Labedaea rhizosphaerae]